MNVTDLMVYESTAHRGIEVFDPEAREVSEESVAALMSIQPMESKIFDAILNVYEAADAEGLTAFEAAEICGLYHQTASTAVSKLVAGDDENAPQLTKTQYVRRNPSKRYGRILVLCGVEFTPREDDKFSPEKVKPRTPKEIAATISLRAIVKELKEKNLVTDLRLLREELLQIVAEMPPMKKEGEAHEQRN